MPSRFLFDDLYHLRINPFFGDWPSMLKSYSDEDLLRLSAGEGPRASAAFNVLYNRHEQFATSIAKGYFACELDISGCVNDSFASVYNNLGKYKEVGKFRNWLAVIVKRNALGRWRDAFYRKAILGDDFLELIREIEVHVEDPVIRDEIRNWVVGAIDRLPENAKRILEQHYFHGVPVGLTGKEEDVKPAASRKRLQRARILLRNELKTQNRDLYALFEGQ